MSSNNNDSDNQSGAPNLEPALLESGISQLCAEIGILQEWLDSLAPSEHGPRRTYEDMLRSRRDMLAALKEQQARLET